MQFAIRIDSTICFFFCARFVFVTFDKFNLNNYFSPASTGHTVKHARARSARGSGTARIGFVRIRREIYAVSHASDNFYPGGGGFDARCGIKTCVKLQISISTFLSLCIAGAGCGGAAYSTCALSIHVHFLLLLFKITIKEANRLMHVLSAFERKLQSLYFVAYLRH